MAELILTPEEEQAATWLELDDATVGKLVKKMALVMKDSADLPAEKASVWWWSAALILIGVTAEADSASFVQDVCRYTRHGKVLGDYRISVERLPACSRKRGQQSGRVSRMADRDRRVACEKYLPDAMQFLFRRMRLLGIVPAFYAGTAHSEATGASTNGYAPDAALDSLIEDIRAQFGVSLACANEVAKVVGENLVDVDLLPSDVAATVARGITQGDVMARTAYQMG